MSGQTIVEADHDQVVLRSTGALTAAKLIDISGLAKYSAGDRIVVRSVFMSGATATLTSLDVSWGTSGDNVASIFGLQSLAMTGLSISGAADEDLEIDIVGAEASFVCIVYDLVKP